MDTYDVARIAMRHYLAQLEQFDIIHWKSGLLVFASLVCKSIHRSGVFSS